MMHHDLEQTLSVLYEQHHFQIHLHFHYNDDQLHGHVIEQPQLLQLPVALVDELLQTQYVYLDE
jgi:hypothetical protein